MDTRIVFEKKYYDERNPALDLGPMATEDFTIYQVGDAWYKNGLRIGRHEQLFDLEISVMVHNAACMGTDGVLTVVDKNDSYVSLKGDIHSIEAKNTCRYQYFAIDFAETSRHRDMAAAIRARYGAPDGRVVRSPALAALVGRLLSEFMRKDEWTADAVNCCLLQILIALLRGGVPDGVLRTDSRQELVTAVRNYIDTRFPEIRSLVELAAHTGYSYPRLSQIFREETGQTVRDYYSGRRMEYAREQLRCRKVCEVAELLGYESIHNFSRAYKKFFGHSPSRRDT